MSVTIGSARIDEKGGAHGGKAGDQKNGAEVSTQAWYKHAKGWRVFRCTDAAKAAKIGDCMQWACANNHIGYDQYDRLTLYNAAKQFGFDVRKVTANVETDCSALVRVCLAYAGIATANFTTVNEAQELLRTGMFVELTDSKYRTQSAYLRKGDILVTKTQGHTVVVLTDGSKAGAVTVEPIRALGDRLLKNGSEGDDVKELQTHLISLGYSCGKWGADGDFGDSTEIAVKLFQADFGLDADGEYGKRTHAALMDALLKPVEFPTRVKIIGGNCYVRTAPSTDGEKVGVAISGTVLQYGGEAREGWLLVEYDGKNGWVSGKYGKLEDIK